jgi:hypothetical protein
VDQNTHHRACYLFFTVCLIEPVKTFIQGRLRRRELRRSLYHEMVCNHQALDGQVTMAKNDPEMKSGIGERFAMGFRKFSLELAQKDPVTYYNLEYFERYWIERRYSDMEHIIDGKFDDDEQHLRCADATAYLFLAAVKGRHLSRRLIFRVSPDWLRKHFCERLAAMTYTDLEPPNLVERMRRRFD